jgi:hypothetical protein
VAPATSWRAANVQLYTVASEDLTLSIRRKLIEVFGDQDTGAAAALASPWRWVVPKETPVGSCRNYRSDVQGISGYF